MFRCDSENGYLWDFQVYRGREKNARTDVGLGERVVLDLASPLLDQGYHLYFDNFFSSPRLAAKLLRRNTYCIGTVRPNRACFPKKLLEVDAKSAARGSSSGDWAKFTKDDVELDEFKVHCLSWVDKKQVTLIDTLCPENLFTTVKRKGKDGSVTPVPCPAAVKYYNKYMGGVDLADNLRRSCTFSLKSVRWYMRIFWYLLESAAVNAHIVQMETTGIKMPQINFRKQLAVDLIARFNSRLRPGKQSLITAGRFRDRHFPDKNESSRGVCAVETCGVRTYFFCPDCNKRLCPVPCFKVYHTK